MADPSLHDAVGAVIDQALGGWSVPGAAVSVVNTRRTLASVSRGWADVASRTPVSRNTRFQIGSISKTFTSMVVNQLADEGTLDLHGPVVDYLPWFEVKSPHGPITLFHLLQHTSGLITGSDVLPDAAAQVWELRRSEVGSPPGAHFHYSNVGYLILGLVVEAVTGRSLAEEEADRLFAPVRMQSSVGCATAANRGAFATGYQQLDSDRPFLHGDKLVPAAWFEVFGGDGNVGATVDDLGRFAQMLLGRGSIDGSQVLAPSTFERMTSGRALVQVEGVRNLHYGLGICVETIDGRTCLGHGGAMVGFASSLIVDLDSDVAVAVLTNTPGASPVPRLVALEVLTRITCELRSKEPTLALDPDFVGEADRYIGEYADSQSTFSVRPFGDHGLVLAGDGQVGRLFDTRQGRLACDHPGWRMHHHRLAGTGDERTWTYGARTLRPVSNPRSAVTVAVEHHPLVGRYRSFNPWYPTIDVLLREDVLRLVAMVGAEAPEDELDLAPVGPNTYRIGADPRCPERLVAGPEVDGRVLWVERDGCRYSRSGGEPPDGRGP